MPKKNYQCHLRRYYSRGLQGRRHLAFAIIACSLLTAGFAHAQEMASGEFDAVMNEAFALAQSAIWYNKNDESVRDSANLALKASNIAKANWGEQDMRFLRAISVFSISMCQNTLGIIANAQGDTAEMIASVETMITEAGSIARTQTQDGEVMMMATLIKARLARVRGDSVLATQLYDLVVQTLEGIMTPENPILAAVLAERTE